MTTVPVTIAKDNVYENLVVKDRSMFEFGTFQEKDARVVDAETATIQTLHVTNLTESGGTVGNPFVTPLAPNEIIALNSTRALITVPYSQGDVANSLIQRTAANAVVARFLGITESSAQIVLGTSPLTTTLTATQNGFNGGVGFGGPGTCNLVLSGGASVINSSAVANKIIIDDSSTSGSMTIHTLAECALNDEASYLFAKSDIGLWQLTLVDLPGLMGRVELRRLPTDPIMVVNLGVISDPIEFKENIVPATDNMYDLGSATRSYQDLFLTTETVTGIGATAIFASAPATGLGTTVSLTTLAQAAETITYTNTALLGTSPILMTIDGYGGTQGIPLAIFDRGSGTYIIVNVGDGVAPSTFNGTVTTGFVILNSNGNGP
jgi:hypothetical protein